MLPSPSTRRMSPIISFNWTQQIHHSIWKISIRWIKTQSNYRQRPDRHQLRSYSRLSHRCLHPFVCQHSAIQSIHFTCPLTNRRWPPQQKSTKTLNYCENMAWIDSTWMTPIINTSAAADRLIRPHHRSQWQTLAWIVQQRIHFIRLSMEAPAPKWMAAPTPSPIRKIHGQLSTEQWKHRRQIQEWMNQSQTERHFLWILLILI